MKIIWSPLAIKRASEIADYISQDSASASNRWSETVFSKVELLKSFPEIGRIVPELDIPQIRELLYGEYRIIYRLEEHGVFILTIRHSKQLLKKEETIPR